MRAEENADYLLPGPLHPDLFDDETPVMVRPENPLNLYAVEVCYVVHEEDRSCLFVAAEDEDEARRLALTLAKRDAEENEDCHEVFDADEIDGVPSQEQALEWFRYREARHV